LAPLLRLGLIAAGYLDPKAERAVRDLLRNRSPLVRQKTANLRSIQHLGARHTGASLSGNRIKQRRAEALERLRPEVDLALAVYSNLAVMHGLDKQIATLERIVKDRIKLRPACRQLLTVRGMGDILALTILLETGAIGRLARVRNFASDCRCVGRDKRSHGKRTGQGHTKNGNQYLAWAFVEAANVAVRDNSQINRYDQRKQDKTHGVVAINAVAHKLARACYEVMRDQVPCATAKAFGCGMQTVWGWGSEPAMGVVDHHQI
jgi:transposase